MRSATSGRMPESPLASTLARISIMARTTSRASGSPTPAQCERITLRCSSSRSPARNAHVGQQSHAGIHRVDGRIAGRQPIDQRARGVHSMRTPRRPVRPSAVRARAIEQVSAIVRLIAVE